jgi:hypothetical protein
MSIETASICAARCSPSSSKKASQTAALAPSAPPHDLAGPVVGDQGQVAVAFAPGDLVDADLEELIEAIKVELVGADALDDPPDGGPVDAQHPLDRRLVGARGKPGRQVLEVARQARAVTRERHALDADAVLRADQPAQPRADLQAPDAEVEMAPIRIDRAHIVTARGRERAQRAEQPTAAQRDLHDHAVGLELDLSDAHAVEAQQTRECGSGAHGIIDLQIAGLQTSATLRPTRARHSSWLRFADPSRAPLRGELRSALTGCPGPLGCATPMPGFRRR